MLPTPLPTKMNLGCGQFPKPEMLNVDWDDKTKADVLLNLDDLQSYRVFPDNHFEFITMDHVLEHLTDVFGIMRELHRILAPGGRLVIRVPHYSRGMAHPEHKHGFDTAFPEYMNPDFKGGYIGVPFQLESMRMDYMQGWDLKKPFVSPIGFLILKGLNAVVTGLANLSPHAASRFWCYWVGGFEQIEFIFIKKDSSVVV